MKTICSRWVKTARIGRSRILTCHNVNRGKSTEKIQNNFIRSLVREDARVQERRVQTRFPPEPSGHLHIGHAKAIFLNYKIASEYKDDRDAICTLRFDDTNPENSRQEYVDSILRDIRWLGFTGEPVNFASNYFDQLYECAVRLIEDRKAYVCSVDAKMWAENYFGSLKTPGHVSPFYEERSVEENLRLLEEMRQGKHPDGSHVLRARIDMSSSNMHLRDPVIYRVKRNASHYRTKEEWHIYPSYDFAHCLSDALEGVSHSFCTLEFEPHREVYEWFLDQLDFDPNERPKQTEFARLNLSYTLTSKRWLRYLVEKDVVDGWSDPRLATLSGLRRRGVPPKAIESFCNQIGVSRVDSTVDIDMFDASVRTYLDQHALRRMCVLDPLKVVLLNMPNSKRFELELPNHPKRPELGMRRVAFGREIYIERSDFLQKDRATKKFKRLTDCATRAVRLRGACVIRAERVVYDDNNRVKEIHAICDFDEADKVEGEEMPKPKAVIHWVDLQTAVNVEVRLYEKLFNVVDPVGALQNRLSLSSIVNENSQSIIENAKLEQNEKKEEDDFSPQQFERTGYFARERTEGRRVYHRTIDLKRGF